MNLLARVKLSAHLIFSSPSAGKRVFYIHPIAALQQCNYYSAKTARSSQKTEQFTKPRTQKSSEPSSTFSQRVKKQADALATVWPKPREIPYQAKVANFVNLIGFVKIPVRFEADSDGKHFATTVISLGSERNSLSVHVVFQGDLAHVAACHLKENDCVFVSGQLSMDPMRLVLSESLGKVHVLAENLNFVEGFQKNVLDKKIGVSISDETNKPGGHKKIEEVLKSERVDNYHYINQLLREIPENADVKRDSSCSVESSVKQSLNVDCKSAPQTRSLELGNAESIPENRNEKSGESASKKKVADQILDLWRNLVKNPLQWWDYRSHKANGLVKEKFPDFKQKVTGESLWISTAPKWVLPGLEKLEFDVKDFKPKEVQRGEGPGERKKDGKSDDSWKNLVENPDKWWDNRTRKKNPKAPDFRHKETGEVLWLNRLPVWALSRLPPMKDGLNTTDGKNRSTV